MNFKKFISGVSAMAIAASAFAAMAVTANAATETVYLDEDFSSYSGETAIAALGTDYTWGKITYRAAGRSGAWAGTASFTSNEDLSVTITRFSGNNRGAIMTFTDAAGIPSINDLDSDAILRLSFDLKAGEGAFVVSGFGTLTANDLGTSSSAYKTVVIDLNKSTSKQTVTVDGTIVSIADLSASTFTGFAFTDTTGTSNSHNVGMYVDNIKVEQVQHEESSVLVESSVVAKCGDTVLSETPITGYEGETYTYSPVAYILKDNVYYRYSAIGTNGEVNQVVGMFAENMSDVELSYSVASAVVDYAEVNVGNKVGHTAFAGAAANSIASGGMDGGTMYGQAGTGCVQTFTVPSNGTYNITVNAVGVASGNRSCYLTVDSTDTANSLGTLASSGSAAKTTVSVHLTEGSHTFYYMSSGSISPKLDYMVVELDHADVPYSVTSVTPVAISGSTAAYTTGDGVWTKAFTFTVTPNDDTVTAVKVTDSADSSKYMEKTGLTLTGGSGVVFGILVATQTEGALDSVSFTPSVTVE